MLGFGNNSVKLLKRKNCWVNVCQQFGVAGKILVIELFCSIE
jgi:hypothetical protein